MLDIIAEIGSVHDGSFGNAKKAIELAKKCGANYVKFQTHIAEAETIRSAPNPGYFTEESRFDYFERTSFSEAQWKELVDHAKRQGIGMLSSPFSIEAVDMLEKVGLTTFKIPSGEVTNMPLLERLNSSKFHVIMSSGMSNWGELDSAVGSLKNCGQLTVLQCTSAYPCHNDAVGLNVITQMMDRYNLNVGFSDHTSGLAASIGAVVLGATVIEKHLTFSKEMYGSDAKNSMEPEEFKMFTKELRNIYEIIQNPVDKSSNATYAEMKKVFEKSIVIKGSIKTGDKLTLDNVSFKKPGTGIPASSYKDILGKSVTRDLDHDYLLTFKDIQF